MSWQERAACLGKPVNWFIAETGSRKTKPIERRALALCAKCPVANECLADVLLNERVEFTVRGAAAPPWAGDDSGDAEVVSHYLEGVWAGTTLEDRKATRHLPPDERFRRLREIADSRARKMGLTKEAV